MAAVTVPAGVVIAAAALKYQGEGYTYGGRADHPGDWDCSSFISYVLGHDLGMGLPGGGGYGSKGFPPNAHGPVVLSYATWAGATTIPGPPSAGDLCVFAGVGPLGHIGIATDATHMISALNPADGTIVTGIAGNGPAGASLIYRRVNGSGPGAAPAGSGITSPAELLAVIAVPVAVALGFIVAAAVAGLLLTTGVSMLAVRVIRR